MILRTLIFHYAALDKPRKIEVCYACANYVYSNANDRGLLDGIVGVDWLESAFENPLIAHRYLMSEEMAQEVKRLTDREFDLYWPIVEALASIHDLQSRLPLNSGISLGIGTLRDAIGHFEPDPRAVKNIIASLMGIE